MTNSRHKESGKNKEKEVHTRLNLVDALRAVSIINMVIFHFLYDWMEVLGHQIGWYRINAVHYWQQYICISFILIAGFVWTLGKKKNIKRGIIINIFGLGISLVTYIFIPGEQIWFGILSFVGMAILLMFPISRIIDKINPWICICIDLLLFYTTRFIDRGYILFINKIQLPTVLYTNDIFAPLGFPSGSFYSSDYFPILPWFFIFAVGYDLFRIFNGCTGITKDKVNDFLSIKIPVLSCIGRKSLLVYILHQPICMAVAFLIHYMV